MKWLIALLMMSTLAQAENSKSIPAFLEAVEIYRSSIENHLYVRPEVRAVLKVLHEKNISPEILSNFPSAKGQWRLPADDQYDGWVEAAALMPEAGNVPEISLHASKLDVIRSSEMKDEIYAYFFITDGVIPTGKVTSVYNGISSGQGFFFNQVDRAIFPLMGISSKAPSNHLIVDYGIVESDGDDIKRLQQLSAIIIDLAIAVYASQNPEAGQVIVNLRKEIKALADLLISFNSDDRLVTGSFGYTTAELTELLSDRTFIDFKQNHKKDDGYDRWEYDLHFRIVR